MRRSQSDTQAAPAADRGSQPSSSSTNSESSVYLTLRLVLFALLSAGILLAFRETVLDLVRLSRTNETYSHMPLIPIVSGYLLFSRRKSIFNEIRSALALGIAVAAMGTALYAVRSSYMACAVHIDALALTTLSALTIWIGGFITLFGTRAFLSASFSLLFLVFLIPIPSFLLQRIVKYLQIASTEVAHGLFWLTGVPFLTDGSSFHLPRISVAVAEQCCGIRSSISLFITGVMASHLFLKTGWGRSLLILSVLPITVFKNALRILTLALLAVYVDQRVLESALHRAGGIPFFGLALLLFGCVLLVLRRTEVRRARRDLRERV